FVAAPRTHEADAEEMGGFRQIRVFHQQLTVQGRGVGKAASLGEPGCSLEIVAQERHLVAIARPRPSSTNSTPALSASDAWMPIKLPPTPTVTPLNARSPMADMAKTPITRPRISGGACSCTSVCAMAKNESSRNPAAKRSANARG